MTLQIEAQALRDDLDTEYLNAHLVANSVDIDVLTTAGYKEDLLNTALDVSKHKVNEYKKVISIPDNARVLLNNSKLLLRVKKICNKLQSIKLKL